MKAHETKEFLSEIRMVSYMLNLKKLFISVAFCLLTVACGIYSMVGNVLIIGDSISIGYTKRVFELLVPKGWNVRRVMVNSGIEENCRNSTYTLQHLDQWLAENPDNKVITWNNGIWDSTNPAGFPEDPSHYLTSPALYESNITQIAIKLKATGARVIFFTTTDVPGYGPIQERNAIAKRVLPALGVEVYDLDAFTRGRMDWHFPNDTVHFNDQANQQELGPFVASAIEKTI